MAAVRPNDDLVARVVAWHNRNPLARRISPAQVVSVGLVSFPFWVPGAAAPGAPVGAAQASGGAATPAAEPVMNETAASPVPPAPGADPGAAAESAAHDPPAESGEPGPDAAESPEPAGPARDRLRDRARNRALALTAAAGPADSAGRAGLHAPPGPGRKSWRAAFEEDLLDPHKPSEVARWALRHGSSQRPGPSEAPVRDLEPRGGGPRGAGVARLWVYTAAIDLGAQRVRVIVSPLDTRRVLGPRIVALGRIGTLAGTLAAGMAAGAAVWLPGLGAGRLPAGSGPVAVASRASATAAAAPGASVPPAAPADERPAGSGGVRAALPNVPSGTTLGTTSGTTPTTTPGTPPSTTLAPALAQTTAPGLAASAVAPRASAAGTAHEGAHPASPDGAPLVAARPPAAAADETPGRPAAAARAGPFIRPLAPPLSEEVRRAAREASEAARDERAARAPTAVPASAPLAASAAPTPAAQARADAQPGPAATTSTRPAPGAGGGAVPLPGTVWAVSTRNLRTRFESEQMLAALRDAAYRGGHGSELKLEVLPSGDDWRAVGWPLATRADAERLRAALAARGLKADVVQF